MTAIGKVLYFLLPLPLAWLSISVIYSYFDFYDMGVNNAANAGALTIIVLPILSVALYTTALCAFYLTKKILKCEGQRFLLGTILMIILAIGTFFIHTHDDHYASRPQNISVFLKYYFLGIPAEDYYFLGAPTDNPTNSDPYHTAVNSYYFCLISA